jgi:hypothetical protein
MITGRERLAAKILERFPDINVDPMEIAELAIDTFYGKHKRSNGGGRAKLSPEEVERMRERRAAGEKQKILAIDFGVSQAVVSTICNGLSWR